MKDFKSKIKEELDLDITIQSVKEGITTNESGTYLITGLSHPLVSRYNLESFINFFPEHNDHFNGSVIYCRKKGENMFTRIGDIDVFNLLKEYRNNY